VALRTGARPHRPNDDRRSGEHINHLSRSYLGRDYARATMDRLLIEVVPERVTGAGGGQDRELEAD
jgi:hypothetical protein